MAAPKVRGAKALLGDPSPWRKRIEAATLLNRLQKFAKGELNLTRDQIKASEILLKKVIPDLASVELSGNPDKPVNLACSWQTPSK